MPLDHVRHVQLAADTAEFVPAALEVLRAHEERQHFLVRPTPIAELRPGVVVQRLAPHVEHAVDRTRPAEHLAPRDGYLALVGVRLRHGLEAPVDARPVDHLPKPHRDVDQRAPVAATGFEQKHGIRRITAQAVRDDTASGTGADHDVVELGHGLGSPPLAARKAYMHAARMCVRMRGAYVCTCTRWPWTGNTRVHW